MGTWGERTVEVPWLLTKIKGTSALDIGCAESCYVNELLEFGITRLVLSDVREFSTHENDPRVKCVVSDLRKVTPKQIGTFDTVLCISTLEHIALTAYGQNREMSIKDSAFYKQKEAFNHMMKFVAPGGQMILTVPYGKYEDSGWVIVYDKGMLDELKAPYEVVEETYFTLVNRDTDGWRQGTAAECSNKGMDCHERGMRANNSACLILKNK